ncbi:MAG: 50S ribosomal protein L24 [Bacteroidetes bacterium]|nr:50S ribosomal protein L24 [Bacteroidota bacterium]MBV6461014.1 50S ribosomal protein L24 [Flavobacteriales bacterium]WKZ75588.1 MAG: 50S ribosomal protein L24 [Vicingaceae bacterium]MCL4815154.1 50S ribosomal protein L24 [Flavobacteriales bacterium]NOG94496.1 50S ribosomal protein L24 [Bacteroidota bacterium]
MAKKLHIKKGDTVKVIAGESKGQIGKIIKVLAEENRVIVEGDGIKKISKHTKPNAANPQGGIIKKEAPIHVSNVMVVNSATGKPARIGRKRNSEGKLERYFKSK